MGKKNKIKYEDNPIIEDEIKINENRRNKYDDIDLKITAFQMAMDVPSASGDDRPAGIRELISIAKDIYNFLTSEENIKK